MLEIYVQPYAQLFNELKSLEKINPPLWAEIVKFREVEWQETGPFVQISYDEIPGEKIDEILGYAGIAAANLPIGLPGDFEPIVFSEKKSEILFFSITNFRLHLSNIAPEIFRLFEISGSMDELVKLRGDDLSVEEYLIGGVLERIQVCNIKNLALCFKW